jgi:hypothetical protein
MDSKDTDQRHCQGNLERRVAGRRMNNPIENSRRYLRQRE